MAQNHPFTFRFAPTWSFPPVTDTNSSSAKKQQVADSQDDVTDNNNIADAGPVGQDQATPTSTTDDTHMTNDGSASEDEDDDIDVEDPPMMEVPRHKIEKRYISASIPNGKWNVRCNNKTVDVVINEEDPLQVKKLDGKNFTDVGPNNSKFDRLLVHEYIKAGDELVLVKGDCTVGTWNPVPSSPIESLADHMLPLEQPSE